MKPLRLGAEVIKPLKLRVQLVDFFRLKLRCGDPLGHRRQRHDGLLQ